jgi:RNA recognition motif-containing protein
MASLHNFLHNKSIFPETENIMKLLIRNLSRSSTEAEMRELFESYGTVQSCTLVTDKETGSSKGFGFVEMPKAGEAKAAMKNLNGKEIEGSRIRVKKSESNE